MRAFCRCQRIGDVGGRLLPRLALVLTLPHLLQHLYRKIAEVDDMRFVVFGARPRDIPGPSPLGLLRPSAFRRPRFCAARSAIATETATRSAQRHCDLRAAFLLLARSPQLGIG